ncbi:excalibur calcium-binding domain-containing protein [Sinosporangium siamense]|uniref:excalibur calcium-binding domain-containing protein n=1 Tax=Sinosporangium siamense TaxID=1367973 RepID=UPI0035ECF4D5
MSAGVLGTIAVLMTNNPDLPLGGAAPKPLAVPIHFAPVTAKQRAPCPGAEAVMDDQSQNCYQIDNGVDVNAVHKIETVAESDGTYAVRIAVGPASRRQIADLTKDTVDQQIVIIVAQKVVAAPKVTQAITEDSLTIDGAFTKEQADALVLRLSGGPAGQPAPSRPATSQPAPNQPAPNQPAPNQPPLNQSVPGQTTPGLTTPGQGQTGPGGTGQGGGTGQAGVTQQPTTGTTTGTTGSGVTTRNTSTAGNPTTRATGNARPRDRRYASCKEAVAAGYGPYYKDTHPEYAYYRDLNNNGVACDSPDMR